MAEVSIQAVCFDMDGLMFNTELIFHKTGTELLRRRGIDQPRPILNQMMGRRAQEAFEVMIQMAELTESVAELQQESDEYFHSILFQQIEPMPGLFELLEQIELRGLPKAVATSSGRGYLEQVLDHFELRSRFDFTLTASDVKQGKPHPEIYQTAAQRFCVAPESMLVLEDSSNGTRAAVQAGAHIVSVPHEFSESHDFSGTKFKAESLTDPYILQLLT